jgi:hypothetical protein
MAGNEKECYMWVSTLHHRPIKGGSTLKQDIASASDRATSISLKKI